MPTIALLKSCISGSRADCWTSMQSATIQPTTIPISRYADWPQNLNSFWPNQYHSTNWFSSIYLFVYSPCLCTYFLCLIIIKNMVLWGVDKKYNCFVMAWYARKYLLEILDLFVIWIHCMKHFSQNLHYSMSSFHLR